MRMLKNLIVNVVRLAAGALLLAGCATTDPNQSDIPWNAPQSWEGAPSIPGFDGVGQ